MPIKSSDRDTADKLSQHIGQRVRQLRIAKGLTQRDLAIQIGMTVQAFARMERGLSLPSFPTFIRVCQLLDTTSDFLLGFDEQEVETLETDEHTRALARLQAQARDLDTRAIKTLEQVVVHMLSTEQR